MQLARLKPSDALNHPLAHSIRLNNRVIRKGEILTKEIVSTLTNENIESIAVVIPGTNDCHEDAVASDIAHNLTIMGITIAPAIGGRYNIYAEHEGLFILNTDSIHALNRVDESITLATLQTFSNVTQGQLLATIKIIPFYVNALIVNQAIAAAQSISLEVRPWLNNQHIALVQTTSPSLAAKVYEKSLRVQRQRLETYGMTSISDYQTNHQVDQLGKLLSGLASKYDLIMILGASATCDRSDVIPSSIESAEGLVIHFGMPVDPGNLLLIGKIHKAKIIGLPGCARSPALNGFDWVLDRLMAGFTVGKLDIQGMGVGGVLKDSPARGISREENHNSHPSRIGAIVLAGGLSSRMGDNKLLLDWNTDQKLIDPVLELVSSWPFAERVLVGSRDFKYVSERANPEITSINNPHPEKGLATSLALGIQMITDVDAIIVFLGDMPLVNMKTIERLIATFSPQEGAAMVYPLYQGERGNPVLIGRRFFEELGQLEGDQGARILLDRYPHLVKGVSVDDPGILLDIDDQETLQRLRQ